MTEMTFLWLSRATLFTIYGIARFINAFKWTSFFHIPRNFKIFQTPITLGFRWDDESVVIHRSSLIHRIRDEDRFVVYVADANATKIKLQKALCFTENFKKTASTGNHRRKHLMGIAITIHERPAKIPTRTEKFDSTNINEAYYKY